jgi:pimeloyl-ACP methyl ester carboxylesterase
MSRPIVFLHGWGRTRADFVRLRQLLEDFGFPTLAFDLPGFGGSAPPPKAWGLGDYARFVEDEIKRRGIGSCILIGHSFGTRIGIVLAASRPEIVERLILIGAPLARSLTFKRRLLMLASKAWRLVKWLPGARAVQNRLEGILRRRRHSLDFLYTPEGVMRETLKKAVSEDLIPYLKRIRAPLLFIYGANDMVTPPEANKAALKHAPQARLEIIPDAGHMVVVEKPEETAKIVTAFLSESIAA